MSLRALKAVLASASNLKFLEICSVLQAVVCKAFEFLMNEAELALEYVAVIKNSELKK